MGTVSPNEEKSNSVPVYHSLTLSELGAQVQRFWEIEELKDENLYTPEEQKCEEIFISTHSRDSTGRYVVQLPIRGEVIDTLGQSRDRAISQLLALEKRLNQNTDLREKYKNFMSEYCNLGHMREVSPADDNLQVYYLPHHAVTKVSNQDRKLRVVFNASALTNTGISLNHCLMPGPKLHNDLAEVITKWRLVRIAFTADIVKMFRQIRIHDKDQGLQRIVWRSDNASEIKDYQLTTVTYGTASAPYLANRVIKQLAHDEHHKHPNASKTISENIYVDDIYAGGDTLQQALELKQDLISLLERGGFELSKWASNHSGLGISEENSNLLLSGPQRVSTLGLLWSPQADSFHLRVVPQCSVNNCTKRSVLSDISRFFDPLGWAASVLIFGKIFLQNLWREKLSWDEPLPDFLRERWSEFVRSLPELDSISIPRFVSYSPKDTTVQLIGFSDASEQAYSAVVYIRCQSGNSIQVYLVSSKTKVAALSTTSIPRLELCGSLLAARLIKSVAHAIDLPKRSWFLFTDAQVVLNWLKAYPAKWPSYVAHRVAAVQEIAPACHWNHVPTDQNPADLSTRGITPEQLSQSRLWWYGPPWLSQNENEWPKSQPYCKEPESEVEEIKTLTCISEMPPPNDIITRFSTFKRLVRIISLCYRFLFNLRNSRDKIIGFISSEELDQTRIKLIKIVQGEDFPTEIAALKKNKPIPCHSPLLRLRPLLTQDGILRVGGRIQNSDIPQERKQPPILNKANHFSLLLARQAHSMSMHGGPLLMQALLSNYWIIGLRYLANAVNRECVVCARFGARTASQQMGSLPLERVRKSRPFLSTGVDFAGPFSMVAFRGRGSKSHKCYISVFVWLASKAIHLELVNDLTFTAFVSAFRKFTARRGAFSKLLSDNATNFRGADVELQKMFREFYLQTNQQLSHIGNKWNFIPPSAPHFGGLWEAGVRSVKYHLRRVVGDQILSYEEMNTFVCQIESCLNSRPLCPISTDPFDFQVLTPGHLLIGEPMVNIPERPHHEDDRLPLTRWQHLSRMRDHWWQRWSQEYLSQLQQLPKWQRPKENIAVGSLVMVKNELQPPARWLLGRVIDLHPGSDNLVSVVTLRTANGLKRPITKICPLSVYHSESELLVRELAAKSRAHRVGRYNFCIQGVNKFRAKAEMGGR